jgi:uncharacterized protein (TIGR03437 family)
MPELSRLKPWCLSLFLTTLLAVPLSSQDASKLPLPTAVAADANGAMYLAGSTLSAGLVTTTGVFQPALPANACSPQCAHGFLAKVAPGGESVAWASWLTGMQADSVEAIVVASDGGVYVAGNTTSSTLTVPSGNPAGAPRMFVARISYDGRVLLAATYFGGSGTDTPVKLALDSAGNVFLAGTTSSPDFPTTAGAYQRTLGAQPVTGMCTTRTLTDQFVAKFDPALKSVLFSTLVGSPETERTGDLAVGSDGSIYLAGTRGIERDCNPRAILTRLNPQGTGAVYSVEEAGTSGGGYVVAVDPTGGAYLASDTRTYSSAPNGLIFQIDSRGNLLATIPIAGLIDALTVGSDDLEILGRAWPENLSPTSDGPAPCRDPVHYVMTRTPYIARLSLRTSKPSYLGYLSASGVWLAAPDRVVAAMPYSTLLPWALLPFGPPAPATVTCIADSGDYQSDAVAPGELISVFGNRIGPAAPAVAQSLAGNFIGPDLSGMRVLANGMPAPLLYADSGQINLVMPFGVAGDQVHFEVYRNQTRITEFDKSLRPRHGGLFTTEPPSAGRLAALNQDGTVNSDANPAASGSIVTIFVSGLGAMTPQLPDGAVPSVPANTPVGAPTVWIAGSLELDLSYVGNAPTLVQGVVQINLRLPGLNPGHASLTLGYRGDNYNNYSSGWIAIR